MSIWRWISHTRHTAIQAVTQRSFSTLTIRNNALHDLSRTRNIGIIAHIDAGKTTTTERMLYYSGHTRRIGDVDDGSTVTDFLPAERARGITIQSAAISFNWPPEQPVNDETPPASTCKAPNRASPVSHNINLIDTPGHADFTFEVLRSLRVLDGAVCILDGVAGVEAQTEKVWHQANDWRIPRIIFVNKLDRDGAAFHRTVKEIGSKLHVWPAICQIPWWQTEDKKFCGVGDAVGLRALLWEAGSDGRSIKVFDLAQLKDVDHSMAQELEKARIALVERLSEHDDTMVEQFLEHDENHLAISEVEIVASLRKCTLQFPQRIAPVLAGASFKNIGVQPLLDAVVDLLPSPLERPDTSIQIDSKESTLEALLSGKALDTLKSSPTKIRRASRSGNDMTISNLQGCALAFKVVNDAKKGVLVYVRVYSGALTRGAQLYNTNLNLTERAPRLLKMYASNAVDIPTIDSGQIGVIVGLKHARTGDTLLSYMGMNSKTGPPEPLDSLQLRPIVVPPPVFFTSIEPESLAEEKQVKDTLTILLREDPSLGVSTDAESGQTHLAGMGELHLEIARDRLINDFKARARIGKIDINYREAIETTSDNTITRVVDRDIGGKHAHAVATASVKMISTFEASHSEDMKDIPLPDNNALVISHPTLTPKGRLKEATNIDPFPPQLSFLSAIAAIKSGVVAALARGPTYGFPIHSTQVIIHLDPKEQIFPHTSPAALIVATREAVQAALVESKGQVKFALMEPLMHVNISVGENDLGGVVHDLSSARGGQIISLDEELPTTSNASGSTGQTGQPYVDPGLIYAPPDPYASNTTHVIGSLSSNQLRQVTARVPLREMVGYLRYLRSLTGGRGTFVMQVDKFEKMTGQRLAVVEREMKGETVV